MPLSGNSITLRQNDLTGFVNLPTAVVKKNALVLNDEIDTNFALLYNGINSKLSITGGTITGDLSVTGLVTLTGGTANGVPYLNGSKVLTTGSALTFDGTNFRTTANARFEGGGIGIVGSGVGAEIFAFGGAAFFSSYNRTTNVNTPINIVSGDYTAFSVGSEQMRLTSTGLGIGTSAPSGKVHAVNTYSNTSDATIIVGGNIPGINLRANNGARMSVFSNFATADSTSFLTSLGGANPSTEVLRFIHTNGDLFVPTGNLGLGVTPSAWQNTRRALQVGTNVALWGSSIGAGSAFFSNNTYLDQTTFRYLNTAGASFLAQQTDGSFVWNTAPSGTAGAPITFTQAMTLTQAGNLLVGTTASKGSRLEIQGSSQNIGNSIRLNRADNLQMAYIGWSDETVANSSFYFDSTNGNPIAFAVGSTERAQITSAGNLLVGTTGLTNGVSSTEKTLVLRGSATNEAASFVAVDQAGLGATYLATDNAGNGYVYTKGGAPLLFGTGNTERARLDASGNLGLATAPFSHGTYVSFDIRTYVSLMQQAGGTSQLALGWNAAGGTALNTYRYKQTGDVARVLEIDTAGFKFLTAASGTAGNTIPFTQAVTINSAGNLLVGGTVDYPNNFIAAGNTSSDISIVRVEAQASNTATFCGFVANGPGVTALVMGTGGAPGPLGGNTAFIYTSQAKPIAFGIGEVEAARITSSRNFLIGTTTDTTNVRLRVAGGSIACYGGGENSSNTAFGLESLLLNTTGDSNTAVGNIALRQNTTGSSNTGIGWRALRLNTTGVQNTGVGSSALTSNNAGRYNTAVGHGSLNQNTTGDDNTAVGRYALFFTTSGLGNTAVGKDVMFSNSTGGYNTAVGHNALTNNSNGGSNSAFGVTALRSNTSGFNNTAVGLNSLFNNTTGTNNTGIGRDSLFNLTTGSGNFGAAETTNSSIYSPVFNVTTENNRIVMGHTSVTNAYIQVAWTVTSDARDKTNFAPVPYGLDFVNQLEPVAYQFRVNRESEETNGGVRYGFRAQDILALEGDNPVIIDTEDPNKLKYNGESLVPVLVNAIKDLKTEIDKLKAEINLLKGN